VPSTLHDTLACVIRAEEGAGNAARALMRLEELSNHVYRFGIERAREHVEIASFADAVGGAQDLQEEQAKARLISKLEPPVQPEGWKALQRLGVSAVMRMDETGWHGMRVGALTQALASAAGCAPIQALEMGLAAELHDIGMMSVPVGILSKRGPLNASELAIMRRHPEAGAEVLSDDRHPRMLMAREIAKYHHAHWDGSGYPDRVGGEFIPLGARMCAITDAYDMMVCGYGTRSPSTMVEALQELRRQAGHQFDPDLVPVFEGLIRDESRDIGVDLSASSGMEDFQELILSLKEDRGFV
jgi:putative two-component system response regulator